MKLAKFWWTLALLSVLGLFLLTVSFINVLNSGESATVVSEKLTSVLSEFNYLIILTGIILLAVASVHFFRTNRYRFFIFTAAHLVFFVCFQKFYLNDLLFHFKKENNLWQGGFSVAQMIAILESGGIVLIVYSLYISLKLMKKIFTEKKTLQQAGQDKESQVTG